MYDIKPLEQEWKKYRKKRQKPWFIAGLVFLIVSLIVIVFSRNMTVDISELTSYFKTAKVSEKEVLPDVRSHVLVEDSISILEIEKSSIKEEPLANNAVKRTEGKMSNLLVDIPVLEEVKQTADQANLKDNKQVHIDIIETSSVTAYEDVEKRFLQSHDVDDALFLANSYYKKGLYQKAEYWALETNKIDEHIEESVLIFVKAKAKLGHKNEAESILTNYISKTASQEAKNVLFRIKNDTL